MQPSKVVGLAAVATAVIVGVVTLADLTLVKSDVVAESLGESKVAWLEDGTKVYRVPVRLRDGGVDFDTKAAAEAPCKRRPAKAVDCQHTYVTHEGKEVTEQAPELNRYPAASMSGTECEGVACSIFLGEDAEAPEVKPRKSK